MDSLTAGIINFKQATTMSQVQTAVAKKILNNQQMQGDAAVQLIQAASKGVGQAGSAMVAATTGLGASIDAQG